jgi:hypothetical protein
MKRIKIFLTILLFTYGSIYAKENEPGFVILNNGDTLRGKIRVKYYIAQPRLANLFHEVVFSQDNKSGTKYLPKDLKGFAVMVDSVYLYFVSKKLNKKLLPYGETEAFLRIVEKGYLSLFEFQTANEDVLGAEPTVDYLIQKESGDIFFLNSEDVLQNTIRDLGKFFGDEPELFDRMKNAKKIFLRIPQYTEEYNRKKKAGVKTN